MCMRYSPSRMRFRRQLPMRFFPRSLAQSGNDRYASNLRTSVRGRRISAASGTWANSPASDNATAQRFFDRAIALDPTFSAAHAAYAQSILMQNVSLWHNAEGCGGKARHGSSADAIEIDPNDADAQAIMAFALWTSGDFARPGNERSVLLRTTPTRHGQTASKARC